MISVFAIVIFPLIMAFAASSDLLTMRISNWLVIGLTVAYYGMALATGIPLAEIGVSTAAAFGVLLVAFFFFAMGWIGGGDAKFVAAVTLWVGFGLMLPYLVYAAVLGGGLTLMIMAIRRYPLPDWLSRHRWIDRLHDNKSGVPYGIALAIAGLMVYPETSLFIRAVGF